MAKSEVSYLQRVMGTGFKAACLCVSLASAKPAFAQDFLEDLELVGIGFGGLSSIAARFRSQSGGLSDGSRYSFDRYYSTSFRNLRVTMLSPLNSNLGILWGFGTGESGAKYRIEPSFKIGLVATEPVGENGLLSLTVSTVVGGHFREGTCTADYGAIGGIQEVNCRLADSFLPPAETLDYLVNQPPSDKFSISVRYQLQF